MRRADDSATVVCAIEEVGRPASMLTLTMRHDRLDRIGLSREARSRRNQLEERRADRVVDKANGCDIDERSAESEEI